MESITDILFDANNKDSSFLPQKYAIEHPESSFKHTQSAYMYFLQDQRDKLSLHTVITFHYN